MYVLMLAQNCMHCRPGWPAYQLLYRRLKGAKDQLLKFKGIV